MPLVRSTSWGSSETRTVPARRPLAVPWSPSPVPGVGRRPLPRRFRAPRGDTAPVYTSTPPALVLPFLVFVNKVVTPQALFHWRRQAAAPIVKQHPLQSSCLENPADRGSWGATVGGVSESDTTEQLSTHTPQYIIAFQHHVEIRCTLAPPFS